MTPLAELMREQKITSRALAEQTGISQRTIESYRSGRYQPTLDAGLKIADALGVDPHALVKPEP